MATEDSNGGVRVGLADIWRAQQETTKAIMDVNVTLTRLSGRMEAIDERNKAADRMMEDHDRRIRVVEDVMAAISPAETKKDVEARLRHLENEQVSQAAVVKARKRARLALYGALAAVAAAVSALVTVLTQIKP